MRDYLEFFSIFFFIGNFTGIYYKFYNRLIITNLLSFLYLPVLLGFELYTMFGYFIVNCIGFYENISISYKSQPNYLLNNSSILMFNILPIASLFLFPIYYLEKILLISLTSDTLQYVFGKYFKNLYITDIPKKYSFSPNKTLHGYLYGGLVTLVISLYFNIFNIWKTLFIIIFGFIGGQFGSYIKRKNNVKDFGSSLGEHGGILDRFDSTNFSISILTIELFLKKFIQETSLVS